MEGRLLLWIQIYNIVNLDFTKLLNKYFLDFKSKYQIIV